jgi:hypothetical protein
LWVTLASSERAWAAPADDAAAKRADAQARFDRGLALLQKKNQQAAALAEFQRAYDLVPATRTLFMIGVIDGMMDRPVDSLRALDTVLRAPGDLAPDELAVARRRREEQSKRVGYLRVAANVPASLQVDGIDTARLPVAAPIAVAAGTRVLTAAAVGRIPVRKEVTVAGDTTIDVAFELIPTESESAHLRVTTNVPDVEISVDGLAVGKTPLPSSLTVAPGNHAIEARRIGYQSARRELALQNGVEADVALELTEVGADPRAHSTLALAISEPESEVAVDGVPRGVYRQPLSLPAGRHAIRVARAGFVDAARTVDLATGGTTTEAVALIPTPDRRAAYVAHARGVRRWGWSGVIAGGALAVAGGVLAAVEWQPVSDARAARDHLFDPGQVCYTTIGADSQPCNDMLGPANDRLNSHLLLRNAGFITAGVGVAAVAVGSFLLATGDDPSRYDAPAYHARVAPDLLVGVTANRLSVGLAGRF